jgi:hypothetical protein
MRGSAAVAWLAGVALLSGCEGGGGPAPAAASASGAVGASVTRPTATAPATAAPSDGRTGVPECDRYLDRERCLREGLEMSASEADRHIAELREGWRPSFATAEGRATMARECKRLEAEHEPLYDKYRCRAK